MRRKYVKPTLISEEFVPNEYAASVCYYIQCEHTDEYAGILGAEDLDGDGITGNHNTDGCRGANNTAIRVDERGNYTIFEESNGHFVGGNAKILSSYGNGKEVEGSISIENLINGDQLIWKTSGRTWRGEWECIHIGHPVMTGSTPNHS